MKFKVTDKRNDGPDQVFFYFWDLDVLEHVGEALNDPMIASTTVEKIV